MIDRDTLRWNGWGREGESFELSPARERFVLAGLGRRLGRQLSRGAPPVSRESLRVPLPKLSADALAALRAACGDAGIRTAAFERVARAAGRSLPDLLRLRRGEIGGVPDVVVLPPDERAVSAVLRVAAEHALAVVPFGGGSSVVGGVDPVAGPNQSAVLALDTTRLDALVRVDEASRTATFQAGIDGPSLERSLAARGLTLGHFPQSFEHSTLGGWIATRSSGQFSSSYGGIERLLVSLRVVTPEGVVETRTLPRAATGPDLNELVLGSEGTLGVIVEATLRVSPAPAASQDRAFLFGGFPGGVATIRALVGEGAPVAMLRLSDPEETALGQLLRHDPERRVDPAALYLGAAARLGWGEGRCALLCCVEADAAAGARRTLARVSRVARANGALPLGASPGRSWRRDRFRTPYLRDWLLDFGVAVDTLETSLPWSALTHGHEAILAALRDTTRRHAGAGIAMAHVSHSYVDGASLYFTVIYPLDGADPIAQWSAIKRDATDAVMRAGGALSHHHGVGRDHAPWLEAEKGALGLRALRAAKAALDPKGLMNPGKLL